MKTLLIYYSAAANSIFRKIHKVQSSFATVIDFLFSFIFYVYAWKGETSNNRQSIDFYDFPLSLCARRGCEKRLHKSPSPSAPTARSTFLVLWSDMCYFLWSYCCLPRLSIKCICLILPLVHPSVLALSIGTIFLWTQGSPFFRR